jgi:hypothetical protein
MESAVAAEQQARDDPYAQQDDAQYDQEQRSEQRREQ